VALVARPGSRSPGRLVTTFEGHSDDAELEHLRRCAGFLLDWDGLIIDHTNEHLAFDIYPDRTLLVEHWYKHPLPKWRNFVAISETLAEWLRERTREEVHVVHNCIDPSEFGFRAGGNYYLFFSKVDRCKGAEVALDLARETGKPFHFAGITGDMSGEVERCGLPNVTFHGEVNPGKRAELFRDAKALVFPTGAFGRSGWREAFGVVMLEALASGCPVIASDNGAVREVVKPGVGFVCDTYEEMRRVIEEDLAEDIDPRECRRHVERNFSHIKAAKRYLDVWRSLK